MSDAVVVVIADGSDALVDASCGLDARVRKKEVADDRTEAGKNFGARVATTLVAGCLDE